MTSYLADPAGSDGLQDAAFDDQNSDAGPAATNAVDASDIAVVGDLVEVLAAVTWVVSRVDETVVLESVRGRILASLERDGLAVRQRSGEDARKVVATITPAGLSRLAATRPARAERLHRLLMSTGADLSRVVPVTELMEDVVQVAHACPGETTPCSDASKAWGKALPECRHLEWQSSPTGMAFYEQMGLVGMRPTTLPSTRSSRSTSDTHVLPREQRGTRDAGRVASGRLAFVRGQDPGLHESQRCQLGRDRSHAQSAATGVLCQWRYDAG